MNVLSPKLGEVHKRNSSVPFAPSHFITSNIPWISKKISHRVFIPNIVFLLRAQEFMRELISLIILRHQK